jgi:hypothetical protein
MYLLFERMYDLLKDNVIITRCVSGIGSLCGLGYLGFVRKGRIESQRLGWAARLAFHSYFHTAMALPENRKWADSEG